MDKYYSNNKSVQILIALLKEHNIKKVIASPGTTNIEFIGSISNDSWFEIYSSVDERSAAYLACGLAEESNEPVVLSCTGATASRNYFSGLTEAYYRQLPVLAITSTQPIGRVDSYSPQFIDRSVQPKDTVKISIQVNPISSDEDEWTVNTQLNNALLELRHRGDGPVHINLTTTYNKDFTVTKLPKTRVIHRIENGMEFPRINAKKIAIYVGTHREWSNSLTKAVELFCEKHNGIVICDHTSNYKGKYKVNASLICSQDRYKSNCRTVDLIVHLGNISGAEMGLFAHEVWRVNPDGILRDTFRKLTNIFEMQEEVFFTYYNKDEISLTNTFYYDWINEIKKLVFSDDEIPFSNVWIAKQTIGKIPKNSVLYLGILNSLRAWNYFELANTITCYANTGGFGIDGMISSLVGVSLNNPNKLCFGVLGDLSFFYDMNVLGNHVVGNNIRLLIVNNGRGTEFTNYNHQGAMFGKEVDKYIAAAGHFGNKSYKLIKHYAEDLGYLYLSARNKNEYIKNVEIFIDPMIKEKPIIFEAFTDSQDESDAIKILRNILEDTEGATKQLIKNIIGEKGVTTIKKIMNRG